jgi:lipopolysaccharide transport system ATP-binding protein
MSDIVIDVKGLSKKFKIGALRQQHNTLRDAIMHSVKEYFTRGRTPSGSEELWALRDVSFQVERGEVLGIIGRNGAGKSTLLKLLSQITEPTEGEIRYRGRVGTLLEVGTGFHPELTGRENIYMNGAILGMTKREIDSRFDEIVEFSEIHRFIDTPVKRYSSGMHIRLAFSVAAHLQPEILLVDEVLAVGDVAFQRKCLGKMSDIAGQGRTVVFVSHNMTAVQTLCTRAILLEEGAIRADGDPMSVISQYLQLVDTENRLDMNDISQMKRHPEVLSDDIRFSSFYLLSEDGAPTNRIQYGAPQTFLFEVHSKIAADALGIGIKLETLQGVHITTVNSEDVKQFYSVRPGQILRVQVQLDHMLLTPGVYRVSAVEIRRLAGAPYDHVRDPLRFEVLPLKTDNGLPPGRGLLSPQAQWEHKELASTLAD